MKQKYPQPRWWQLYLVLPLAVGLFWGIQKLHASGAALSVLQIAVLVVLGVYVEVWRLTNKMALLHHPFVEDESQRVYNARRVTSQGASAWERAGEPVVVAEFYSDLFPFPEVIRQDCGAGNDWADGSDALSLHREGADDKAQMVVVTRDVK